MSLKTCPSCKEDKPRKAFWGKHRQPQEICTTCRRKQARHERYLREKDAALREQAQRTLRVALDAQEKQIKESVLGASIAELDLQIKRIRYKLAKHEERQAMGLATQRTEHAVTHQTRKLTYLTEVRDLMMADAGQGECYPLEYYLSDTALLHKHGFPVVVEHDKPEENENE